MTTIINLLGPPGCGKSTAAAGLFYLMKKDFLRVELVTEYAKDLIYSGQSDRLVDQAFVFAEQHYRISRLIGQVDYVITDSPLAISAFYAPDDYPPEFRDFVMAMSARYDNVNFYLERDHPYAADGRVHTETESQMLDPKLRAFLSKYGIGYTKFVTGDDVCDRIHAATKEMLAARRQGKPALR